MPAEPETRRIRYVDLAAQFRAEEERLMGAIRGVFESGFFVGGSPIEALEQKIAAYLGVREVITLNSGTDALIMTMKAYGIGPGDEVITPPNSFVASTAAIVAIGATPVFCDVLADQNIDPVAIGRALTEKTRAIMPVHLTGRVADMGPIMAIAAERDILVIEDAAQSFGSRYDGKFAGAIGHAGCFSAHPLKNLNAAGDAGFVTTNDSEIAAKLRIMRNHGLIDRDTVMEWGTVSRLDTMQAAILLTRLETVDDIIAARRANATRYRDGLAKLDPQRFYIPACRNIEFNTFHTFVVQAENRDALRAHLAEWGIETAIHYPKPIHLQPAAHGLGYKAGDFPVTEEQSTRIVSLPIHQFLSAEDIEYICTAIGDFYA